MILSSVFRNISFPWLLIDKRGKIIEKGNGVLFQLPNERDAPLTISYCQVAPIGFSRCPLGFAVYVKEIGFRRKSRLVLYGLKVTGVSTRRGKSDNLSIKVTRQDIERYTDRFLNNSYEVAESVRNLLSSSVHEIRSINTDIKNAAREIMSQENEKEIDLSTIIKRGKNINGLSEILSTRTDFLDFIANPSMTNIPRRVIRVFQKFDKVKRSLENRANQRNINIIMKGISVGSINALVVFEVVPYLILQNAIKYSPRNKKIEIEASENSELIIFRTTNKGPKLETDEFGKIFEQGFRGRNACEAGMTGSGFGLFFLKELVELHHGGSVDFVQEGQAELIDGVEFRRTIVTITLARAD